jgi:hypothetical protein
MMTLSRLRMVMEGCSGDTASEECKRALDGCHLTPSPPKFASVVETIAATEDAMHDDDAANAVEDSANVSCAADILCFQKRQTRSSNRG